MGEQKTTIQFVKEALSLHPNYDYSKSIYKGNKTKLEITCDKGHTFFQTPNHHLRGEKCPYCQNSVRVSIDEFIRRGREKHGNKYDYSKVKFNAISDKVEIICPIHGSFFQVAGSHFKCGCRKCGRNSIRKTNEDFINKLKSIYGDRFDYSKVKWVNRETPITLICSKHGEIQRIPRNLLKKHIGCEKCYKETTRITQEEFIERSKQINGDKFDYSKVKYVNMLTPITLICNAKRHEYKTKPSMHLFNNCGCPICDREKRSRGETAIRNFLLSKNIEFEEQKTFDGCVYKTKLLFDFYIPKINTCIEYQGRQHYIAEKLYGGEEEFKKRQIRDQIKKDYCKTNNIDLYEIKYGGSIMKSLQKLEEYILSKGGA